MNWKVKGAIQKTLSNIPGGLTCNYFLQKNFGYYRGDKAIHGIFKADVTVLFERLARIGVDPHSCRVFEIGTGWVPVFPLCLALAGFRDITTVDLHSHLRAPAIRQTLLALKAHLDHPCFQMFSSSDKIYARYEQLIRSADILAAAGISYKAPCNAASPGLPVGSLDLIISNNVFEHVPTGALIDLFAEAKRLLRPNGHILHCINCGDHYAYADPTVTQINYLKFSEADWSRWNNSIQFQNRLRPIDFLEMAEHQGFQIDSAEYTTNPTHLKLLESMIIAPEFKHYSLEQLASTSLTLIGSS